MGRSRTGRRRAGRVRALAVAMLAGSGGVALAECRIEPIAIAVASGEAYRARLVTDGKACDWIYWSGVRESYETIAFIGKPSHGRLSSPGGAAFRYVATPHYRGPDRFTVRLCGRSQGVKGCSKVTYDVAVE